jgi:hypothetical protein
MAFRWDDTGVTYAAGVDVKAVTWAVVVAIVGRVGPIGSVGQVGSAEEVDSEGQVDSRCWLAPRGIT